MGQREARLPDGVDKAESLDCNAAFLVEVIGNQSFTREKVKTSHASH